MSRVSFIPTPPVTESVELTNFLYAVKNVLDNLTDSTGSGGDTAAITKADIATVVQGLVTSSLASTSADAEESTDTPPRLSGLVAYGGVANNILTWDAIPRYNTHSHVNIYRAAVDDFSQASKVGSSTALVANDYCPNDTDYYYWIKAESKAGIEGPVNQSTGTQSSPDFFPTHTIVAERIIASTLAAISANLGEIISGKLVSPDGTFIIDLSQKEIMITGPNGQASDDYIVIRNGSIEAWEWNGSTHLLSKALTHHEIGTASNGSVVQIPGYFSAQPGIIVSPREIQTFDADNVASDQSLKCEAANITEYATGQWQFTAIASLILSAGGGSTTVNWEYSGTTSGDIDSQMQTTAANVVEITANIKLQSVKGYGAANTYQKRKAVWKIFYRVVGDYAWIEGSSTTTYIGATLDWVYATDVVTGLTANAYEFYVEAVYSDDTGTFTSGVAATTQDVVGGTASAYDKLDYYQSGVYSDSATITATLPSYSVPSGWEITEVLYEYDVGYYCKAYTLNRCFSVQGEVDGYLGRHYALAQFSGQMRETGVAGAGQAISLSHTSTSFSTTAIQGSLAVHADCSSNTSIAIAEGRFTNGKATITRRQLASTTPANDLGLINYQYETGSSTQINSGLLNWQAIGR